MRRAGVWQVVRWGAPRAHSAPVGAAGGRVRPTAAPLSGGAGRCDFWGWPRSVHHIQGGDQLSLIYTVESDP